MLKKIPVLIRILKNLNIVLYSIIEKFADSDHKLMVSGLSL